jgi:hypothetical protein
MPAPDAGVIQRSCPMPMATADAGALSAVKAQICNYPGSMGQQHWYRAFATLPGGTTNYVQIELYDKLGAFAGGTVRTGSFPVDPDPASCGVCVRGLGDKGAADAKEYFATGGMVNITAIGGNGTALTATLSNISFVELDSSRHPVSGGCTATLGTAQLAGTVMQVGGTGGGGGGGGGGGAMCAQTVGE